MEVESAEQGGEILLGLVGIVDENGGQHGQQLNASLIDQLLVATIVHPASGNSCTSNITLIDNLPPVIDCSSDTVFIWCNTPLESIETPSVTDNVSPTDSITFTYTDLLTDLECDDSIGNVPVTAYLQRTWTATDEHGNSTTCTQHIFLKKKFAAPVL